MAMPAPGSAASNVEIQCTNLAPSLSTQRSAINPTMKLWIFSDLHLDVNARYPFALPDPGPAMTWLLIGGDIQAGMADAVCWLARQGLNERPCDLRRRQP